MLITVTGCRTGKKYTMPVGYYEEGGYLWVITNRDRTWWKNLRGGAQVELLLKRRSVSAFAEPELDEQAVEKRMYEYFHHMPQAAKQLGVQKENGGYRSEDVVGTAIGRLFVRIRISSV